MSKENGNGKLGRAIIGIALTANLAVAGFIGAKTLENSNSLSANAVLLQNMRETQLAVVADVKAITKVLSDLDYRLHSVEGKRP